MQAQPQSTLAARIFSAPPAAPTSAPPPLPNPSRSTPPLPARCSTSSLANNIGLAHDAGNLLSALGLYSDLLSVPGVLRPEHQHYATELRLISDRSSKLIQHLLTNTPPAAAASFDTTQPASNHASTLHNLAPVLERIAAGAATVSVACPATLPALDFPVDVIERITVNLVRNAAEAIRFHRATAHPSIPLPPGEIYINLAVIAGRVQLTVQDNGPGMPPAIAAAYLQPTPLPQGASRGLGHRIVHELATSSEGQLSIRVRPGSGTTFCVKWTIPSNMLTEPCCLLADPLRRTA